MKLELSQLPDTSILIAMLRILLDALVLCIARCYWLRNRAALEKTFSSRQIPIEDYYRKTLLKNIPKSDAARYGWPICISSNRACRITFLRIRIMLSNSSTDDKFHTGAYIDIEGLGDFGYINLLLPMIIVEHWTGTSDGVFYTAGSDRMCLLLMDQRDVEKRNDPFRVNIYRTVAMPLSQAGANVTVSLPIGTGPSATGLPMTTAKEFNFPLRGTEAATTIHFPYFPCVEKMELILDNPPKSFSFDPLGQAPHPEYYSDTECRWISGADTGSRPHSSISSRLIHGVGEERLQISRIRDGIGVGIWTAVFVTVSIDLLWMLVELLRDLLR
jgi:hypothetical protein